MAVNRSPWRALRPVLLAGAAAVTWLTFSAPAASADALPDATYLLGGVTSSVSSVAEKLPAQAPAIPAPAPVPSPGLLQPVAGEVSGLADQIISSVPVVNHVVPAAAVSVISAPIAQVADSATTQVGQAVIAPVAEALPVLEPVLQPVSSLVAGSATLPVELPELPLVSGVPTTGVETLPANEDAAFLEGGVAADATVVTDEALAAATPDGALAIARVSALLWAFIAGTGSDQEWPTAYPFPTAQAPATPASGSGSGTGSAGSPGAAAWLSPFNFEFATPGAVSAVEFSEHAPAPVSFDPGSSPD